MTYTYHQLTTDNAIATIALNNAPLNINTQAVMQERCEVFSQVLDDDDIRAVILTSAIDGQFGAGNDLKEYLEHDKTIYKDNTNTVLDVVRRFIESDKISIAAINGNAIGSSADLTLMCDIRVMGKPYYLRWPEVYFGLMPNWGASTLLPMLVGRSHALEWLLAGRHIYTDELQEAGLLHGIYEPDTVLAEAQKLAQRVIKAHPQSVKAVKSTVLHSFFMPLQYAFNADAELSSQLFGEPVQLERTKSFLEKRHAEFLPTEGTE